MPVAIHQQYPNPHIITSEAYTCEGITWTQDKLITQLAHSSCSLQGDQSISWVDGGKIKPVCFI